MFRNPQTSNRGSTRRATRYLYAGSAIMALILTLAATTGTASAGYGWPIHLGGTSTPVDQPTQTTAPKPPASSPTPTASAAVQTPTGVQPFLIFYGGYPNNGSSQLAAQVAHSFAGYPIVVFGDAWTFPEFAAKVQADLPDTQFFGYAFCLDRTWQHIQARLQLLHQMHFQGVLLDGIGSGYSSTTAHIQKIVDYAHRMGLRVLIDTWFPDVLNGVQLTSGSDGYLCENWVYSDGQWRIPRGQDIYSQLAALKQRGILIYMIVTMNGANFTPQQAASPVAKTIAAIGGQYISVSGEYYSAQSNAVFPEASLEPLIRAAVAAP